MQWRGRYHALAKERIILYPRLVASAAEERLNIRLNPRVGSEICALLRGRAPTVYHCGMFIIPHGAPEGYEWFVTLEVLVGLYFAVCNFMRARR